MMIFLDILASKQLFAIKLIVKIKKRNQFSSEYFLLKTYQGLLFIKIYFSHNKLQKTVKSLPLFREGTAFGATRCKVDENKMQARKSRLSCSILYYSQANILSENQQVMFQVDYRKAVDYI